MNSYAFIQNKGEDVMKNKVKEDKLLRLTKSHIWIRTTVFICLFVLTLVISVFFALGLLLFQTETDLGQEIDHAKVIAKLYENNSNESEPYGILENSGLDLIVLDESNSIIYQKGRDTRGNVKEYFYSGIIVSGFDNNDNNENDGKIPDDSVLIWNDEENGIIKPSDGGTIMIEYSDYFKALTKSLKEDHSGDNEDTDFKMISMPVWARIELSNGQSIICKCVVEQKLSNIIYMILLMTVLAVMILIMLIMLIVDAVRNILIRRKMLKVLFTDVATGGYNMIRFMVKGRQILRKRKLARKCFAVIRLEFVNYRRFCVCHGVAEGEDVLRAIYARLKMNVSRNELVSHSADGRFALMLCFDDGQQLTERIDSMIEGIQNIKADHTFAYHAGICLIDADKGSILSRPRKGVDLSDVYNNACTACATLEDSGETATCVFSGNIIEDQKWIDTVEERQRTALANEEFEVYYQPKYDPSTNELKGAEALIRWQSPEFGLITPYKFIPIFEKNGFITEIDHYMISHVARDQKMWLDQGYRCVPVSVNVSRAHFIESDLAEQIRDLVDKEGAPHHLVEIELTESAFFDDKKAMINTITRLKEYGFAVSMDDFGSGYSSLNSLKDMPLDVLKLDAEFFRGEEAGTDRGEIVVKEAIKLAKSLNMRTVAEGVEIKEQVDFLASHGCDMIQGYYFAKPMPKAQYEERMKNPIKADT